MWLMASIDYHSLLGKVPALYLLSVVTLLAVLLVGTKVFGSKRWIPVFGFTFQISEFVKIGADFAGRALPHRAEERHPGVAGADEIGRAGRASDAPGDQAAGPGNRADLSADPGDRRLPGRAATGISGCDRLGCGLRAAGQHELSPGLSESGAW